MDFTNYFPVYKKLSPEHQQEIAKYIRTNTVKKGTIIHNGDADCTGLLLIKSGQLRAYILSDEGREITMYRLFEMDICLFSASCIMSSIQFEIIIEAEKDTSFFIIPADIYKHIMDTSAPLANFTREIMSSRFSEVMWLIEQIMWKSMDKRVAAFLLDEINIEGINELKITHEKIANHLGTHREVVTRMLRYLQSDGLIKLSRGTITVLDEDGLDKLQEG